MDDKSVADYFVVAGLDWSKQPLLPQEEVFPIEAKTSAGQHQDPMVELAVINRTMGESIPDGFKCIEFTPTGFPADLNHGSIRAPEMFLCYRRGRDMPSIVDVGVLYEGKDTKERLLPGCEVIYLTPCGRSANVNNSSGTKIFVTFRRASPIAPCDVLVVTEICIVLYNKGEFAPHAHCIIRKNLNRGMMGSEVYLCYKKSMVKVNCLAYKPSILSRYPVEDLPNLPLPQQVSMFCLPMGATLESWPPGNLPPTPVFSTFILTTGIAAEKVYGAAVVFQEPLPQEKVALLDEDQRRVLGVSEVAGAEESPDSMEAVCSQKGSLVVHQNKSICLLSRSPFFDTFKKFLFYIYRLVFSKVDLYSQQIPLERHVAHFLSKIPMPCIQRPRIMIQLSPLTAIILTQPDETPLPKNGASFVDVLKNLGPTNCVLLLLSCLMEHKILVHSLRPAVLTGVAEAIAAMIFPLHWQCPYIPLCPLSLSYVLHSPTPFIVGIDSRYFDTFELPTDVTCVDLDTNTLTISEDRKSHTIKMLPKKPSKLLKSSLERLYGCLSECPEILTPTLPREGAQTLDDQYFNAELAVNKKRMQLELLIREAYLRFMASILKGYNNFLLPITNAPTDGAMDLNSLFDILGFVKSRDKAYHKFYALLMKTQSFSRFIEERSFVSDKDSSLAFFDYCLDKVDEGQEGQRLIEIDETLLSSERTVLIMGPEPDDPDHPPISYPGYFPDLDPSKFNENSRRSPPTPTSRPSQTDPHPAEQGQTHHLGSKTGYNSPMVCRTQHEIKQSQKIAMKHANVPGMWARFLAWHCYSLWFIHLSSYARNVHSKSKVLRSAYDILVTMQSSKLQPPDEVCYRVLMQLCGIYQLPVLAVKVLFEMKRKGIQPNAITYGFYNKAVLESKWPTSHATADQLWTKLRNVVMAVAYFKRGSSFCAPSRRVPLGGVGPQYGVGTNRSRPPIPRSNSESDPDGQSVDSYLDSVGIEVSSISAAVLPGARSSNIVSNIVSSAGQTDLSAEEGKPSSSSRSPRKFFVPENEQFSDEPRNNSNGLEEDSAVRNSPGKSGSEKPPDRSLGGRQRARSTGEVGGDINLIGAIKHKSKESISAGGLSDRGYGSLSMEETREGAVFSSQSLSATKGKEIHKSAEVTPTHGLSNEAGTSKETGGTESPEKVMSGSFESSPSVSLDWQTHPHLASTASSVRIPVTQNDPLGLFNPPAPLHVTSTTDVTPKREKLEEDRVRMTKSAHLLLFTSPSFNQSCPGEEVTPTTPKMTEPSGRTGEVASTVPYGSARQPSKTSTWVAMAAENVVGGGSELLGSALKMVTNRISRYREVISSGGARSGTPSSGAGRRTESSSSLNSAESSSDCSNGGFPTFSALPDKRHGETIQVHDSESGVDLCLPPQTKRSSVTFQETPNRGSSNNRMRNAPFVSNLWNGLRNFQKSDAFKGLASGLSQVGTSVKATVKETLTSDVWGLHNAMPFGALPNVGADFYGGSIPGSIDEENEEGADDGMEAKDDGDDDDDDLTSKRLPLPQLNDPTCPYVSTVRVDLGQTRPGNAGNPSRDSNADSRQSQYDPGSLSSIPSNVSGTAPPNPRLHPVQVEMSTLNKCSKCLNLVYDEEIMAGWTADDSNLNTSCQFCASQLVPFINIYIKDYRPFLKAQLISNLSQSSESVLSCQSSAANPHQVRDDLRRATVGTFESTPTPNPVASIDSTLPASSSAPHGRPSWDDGLPEGATEETTKEASTRQDAEEKTISGATEDAPVFPATSLSSPAVDSLRRRKSISSLPEASEGDRASAKDRKNKSGSVDALNDSRNNLDLNRDPVEPLLRSENEASPAENFVELEPQCYPYLSPLVLRKEVENLLIQEGDSCFDGDALLDEHPILFWNLVWYFKRLDVPSHLPSFVATCKSLNRHLEKHVPAGRQQFSESRSKRSVSVRAVWDDVRLHADHGPPMYVLWNQVSGLSTANDIFSKKMMTTMVECVMRNDVSKPLRLVLSERARRLFDLQTTEPSTSSATSPPSYTSFHSIYRDILFLSFVALGRDNIDVDAFDKEFKSVLADLTPQDSARLGIADGVPRAAAIGCRKVFKDLEI